MKRDASKFFVLGLFSILLISFIAGVASAAQTPTEFFGSVKDGIGGAFMKLFGDKWGGTAPELAVVKFLFGFLLFLIILAVSEFIPFLENSKVIKYIFSAIVSYLSIMYIAPADFYTILISYTTMAIVITSLIPLAIIFALMYGISIKPTAGKIILQKLFIGLYCIVLAWRILQIWAFKPEGVEISTLAIPIYGGTLVIMGLLLWFNQTVRTFLLSSSVRGYLEVAETLSREEAMADAMLLRERATIAEKGGAANVARNLRAAAERMENHAKAVSRNS